MSKSRALKIPPIPEGGTFNLYFPKQCALIINDSILPDFQYITNSRIDTMEIEKERVLSLIRSLNPNKATGSDEISG